MKTVINPRAAWRRGRMKPCLHCGKEFWCFAHKDAGGTGEEKKFCSKPCYFTYYYGPEATAARFWSRVDKRGENECWPWTGSRYKRRKKQMGYGRNAGSGPYTYAHRCAWIFTHGDVPAGKLVMHSCDNPICCNPAHLSLGTDADNTADKIAKGRYRHRYTPMDQLLHPDLSRRKPA